jgi:hypothetical protein
MVISFGNGIGLVDVAVRYSWLAQLNDVLQRRAA